MYNSLVFGPLREMASSSEHKKLPNSGCISRKRVMLYKLLVLLTDTHNFFKFLATKISSISERLFGVDSDGIRGFENRCGVKNKLIWNYS